MIKTESTLTLNKDEEFQLREQLGLLNDFSTGRQIAEADKPRIREIVWSLQKKLKQAELTPAQSRQATA